MTSPPSLNRPHKWQLLLAVVIVAGLLAGLLYSQVVQTNTKPSDCSLIKIGTISLPNNSGRIDHMAYDTASKTLAIAARNNNSLAIANEEDMRLVKSLNHFSLPQWAAFVNQGETLVVTSANGTVSVLDSRNYARLTRINLGTGADSLSFDPTSSLLYVGYGSGTGGVAIIRTTNWTIAKQAPLTGHPEATRLEMNGSRLFVNLPADNSVAVIDKANGQIIANWPVKNATGVYPMAMDEVHHILFVGSRAPDRLIMINTTSGAEISEMNIPGDADDMFYDTNNSCIYISSGAGAITLVKELNQRDFKLEQVLQTYPGARTSLLDPSSGLYFLAVPASQNASAMVVVYREGR